MLPETGIAKLDPQTGRLVASFGEDPQVEAEDPFLAGHMLLPGRRLELQISWPAQLDNKCALKLVARGRVVRFESGRTAIEIQQYEFRTQATVTGPRLIAN